MNLNDWHHYDFGDYRIGVTRIEDDPGTFALLFLVDDTGYPLAFYPNEEAAREALRVLDAGMKALADLHRRQHPRKPVRRSKKAAARKPAARRPALARSPGKASGKKSPQRSPKKSAKKRR